MPKMKTRKSAKKRFSKTGTGKITHSQAGNRHLSSKKSPGRKRRLRKSKVISGAMALRTKKMI